MSLELCRRLLARALSFATDAVIANGDHVYWDPVHGATAAALGQRPDALAAFGAFNLDESVLGGPNEEVLKRVVGPQIADLYGTIISSRPIRTVVPAPRFRRMVSIWTRALPPVQLELVERMIVLAQNGFDLIDIEPRTVLMLVR